MSKYLLCQPFFISRKVREVREVFRSRFFLLLLCAPVMAAPHGGKGRAPKPAPRHQTVKRPPAPKHHTPKKHHRPAPRNHHERHNVHHHHGGHHNGWVTFGAAVVGGLVGGLLGACQ